MIKENISLKPYNTFGVEANARYFAEVNSVEELKSVLEERKHLPNTELLLLGGGSNMLLTKDFEGLAIKLNLKGISEEIVGENEVLLTGKAGENWHEFVQYALAKNYGGLENLSLIPGNVGTCPVQNIGAYGVEIKDVFHQCKALNIDTLQIETFNNEQCRFGYRESFFKLEGKGKYIILEVTFRLTTTQHNIRVEYGAIKTELEKMNIDKVDIQKISESVVRIRESKLPNPKQLGNAGSFFKNPVISQENYQILKEKYPEIQAYPNGEMVKVPAGWLIEHSGWKGKSIGNVATHHQQALVIVNKTGMATGQEIYDFSTKIIEDIKEKYGIELEREVNII